MLDSSVRIGSWAMASDINDFDVIVGVGDAASGVVNAVRWDASGPSSLGSLPGAYFSHALAINNNDDGGETR